MDYIDSHIFFFSYNYLSVITKNAVTGQYGILSDKTILSPSGSLSFYCLYNSHIEYIFKIGCKVSKKYWNYLILFQILLQP